MKQFDPIYTANDNLIVNCKNINLILGDNKTIRTCLLNPTYTYINISVLP